MSAPIAAPQPADAKADASARLRRSNVRTALVLLAIAVVFFFGIIATKLLGDPRLSISVLGAAVLLFLVVAIGRNLRK
jgi:ABC-type multidrug transport system fused ATPase/permease subunit